MPDSQRIYIDNIAVLEKRRPLNHAAVDSLKLSIQEVGLRTPLTVRIVDQFVDVDGVVVHNQPVLVAGHHRLAAVKELGWDYVECFVADDCDEITARLWEIAENLHRAELTVLERDEQVAEWIELSQKKRDQVFLAQNAPKINDESNHKVKGRPETGLRLAARELGIERTAAQRAQKIASLTDEAKAAAVEVGLDDNRSALLAAASRPAEEQAQAIKEEAAKREAKKQLKSIREKMSSASAEDAEVLRVLKRAWTKASEDCKCAFLNWAALTQETGTGPSE